MISQNRPYIYDIHKMMVLGGDDVVLNILYLYILYHTQTLYFIYFHTAHIHKDVHYIFLRTGYIEKIFKVTELIEVLCTTYS
jgi:hypothetical protein